MERFIFLIWIILLFALPLAFIVTGFCKYINGGQPFDIFLKILTGLIIHIFIAIFTVPFMFIMVYGGAHSEPVGEALNSEVKLIYYIGLLIYCVVGWLLCSLIYGKLIKPKINLSQD